MEIETKNVTSQNRWLETYLAMDKGFLRVGDYDGDGDDELAALWQWSSGRTNITSFNSTPGFGWKSTYRSNLSEKSYWLDNAVLNNQGFVLSGDYNGDAQDELAVLWQTPQPESSERNPQTHITIFDAPVDFQWSETNHEVGLANFLEAYVRNGKGFVRTGDFDGDGKDEIGVLWQDGDGWTNITLLDMVNDQAWDPIDAPNVLNASVGETEWLDSKVRNGQGYVLVGDHNGNGTDAFIVLSKTEDEMMEITLFENPGGAGWDISTTAEHAAKLSWNDIGLLSVIDIDNDNRAEVVSVFENESKVNIQSWDWRGPDGHAGIDEGQVGNTAILSGAYLAISQRRVGPQ